MPHFLCLYQEAFVMKNGMTRPNFKGFHRRFCMPVPCTTYEKFKELLVAEKEKRTLQALDEM